MEKDEVAILRESLNCQSLIMHKLQMELEEEREASASAAAESLSMILRLQEQKAIEKMEACQYKRMAEEKLHHAEESLMILEELLYQKEMEVASLKSDIEDYVDKFPLVGDDVPEGNNTKLYISENETIKGPIHLLHTKNTSGRVRRNSAGPADKLKAHIESIDKEVFLTLSAYSTPRHIDDSRQKLHQMIASEKQTALRRKFPVTEKTTVGNCACCFEQEEEIKENAIYSSDYRSIGEEMTSDLILESENPSVITSTSSGIANTMTSNSNDVLEISQYDALDHPELSALKFNSGSKFPGKVIGCSRRGSRLDTSKKEFIGNQRSYLVQLLSDVKQIDNRLQKLDRVVINQEKERQEQIKLLKEMREQLKSIQSNMNDKTSDKIRSEDTSLFTSFIEAMLSFSI